MNKLQEAYIKGLKKGALYGFITGRSTKHSRIEMEKEIEDLIKECENP